MTLLSLHCCYSGAILRYLAAKYEVPDHWYPSKLESRSRVDEFLEWTDPNIRAGAAGYFYNKVASCSCSYVAI